MPDAAVSADMGALIDELLSQTEAAKAAGEIDLLSAHVEQARHYAETDEKQATEGGDLHAFGSAPVRI